MATAFRDSNHDGIDDRYQKVQETAMVIDEKKRGELAAEASQHTGKVVGVYGDVLISADGSAAAFAAGSGSGVAVQANGTVFMSGAAKATLEGALSEGSHVVDVGAMSLKELRAVVKAYNEAPWTTKEGLDAAKAGAAALADSEVVPAAAVAPVEVAEVKVAVADAGETKDAPVEVVRAAPRTEFEDKEPGSAITDANRPYVVYADDGCIGKSAAGLLDGLDYFHQADKAAVVGNGKPTVVFFWAKFAKGDFATVNVFSYVARSHPDVQVVGVSCDPHKADAEKYMAKVGVFQKELGTSGLTPEADCALAYDPERVVKERFLAATAPSSTTVGVGHSYLIDGAGTIVWRERYTRGFSPMGQMLEQVERLVAGKALVSNGLKAVEADDGAEEEEEVAANTEKIKIPGEEDY